MDFQKVGARLRHGECLTVWKRNKKGKWLVDIRAEVENNGNDGEFDLEYIEPTDSWYLKHRSKVRLNQREDIVLETDKLMSTVLKADNPTAYKEFLSEDVRFLFPWTNPMEGKAKMMAYLKKQRMTIETVPEEVKRSYSGDFAYTKRVPLGVCVGIGAWNYPQQIACWKGAPALVAGNAMVFKPSENTPLGALKIAEILIEAGLPKGLYNVIQGDRETGPLLINHPDVAKVSLTGSVPTGRKVAASAAGNLKHVTMELGGKSPLIVFDDADIDSAIGGAMLGNFYSTGQVCSNGTRVFVNRKIKSEFLKRLKARTDAMIIGDPMDEATQIGPMVSWAQREKVLAYIEKGKAEGATLLTGGGIPNNVSGEGYYIQPTVFADVTDDMTIAREEIFGPVMCVLDFDDEAEVIARANATEFGLSGGVFTADLTRAHRVVDQLEAGTLWINTYNLCPVEIPFGGSKQSGFGRENSLAALEHYSELKTVYVSMGKVEAPY